MGNLLIVGAGGHGRVLAETAELLGIWDSIAFLDDKTSVDTVMDYKIIGKIDEYSKFKDDYEDCVVGLGHNEERLGLIDGLLKIGYKVPVIIHPKAVVSKYSSIMAGSVILAGAVVSANTTIGTGCIININCCIDHDCTLYDGIHISSGAVIRSGCSIGKLSYIGAGTCIKNGAQIGEGFILGDGELLGYRLK
jgi:sugar O-acyltransferase (sialic acid O-acetyltransferase NeuD family)